jgi:hypothetical protein
VKRLVKSQDLKLFRDAKQLQEGKYSQEGIDAVVDAQGNIIEGGPL